MSTRRTTTPEERVDLLLRFGEQFLARDLLTDAIRFYRDALAQCAIEERAADAHAREGLATRALYARSVLERLGAMPKTARARPQPMRAML